MKANDYRSTLKPVWCSGCGDYGVLKGLTQALADLEVPPERLAVISGIGCSSRLPGYTRSYAFNSLHGRALPIATGLKAARPDMTTVVVSGDGDAFSIGLGHIPHAIRRNVDVTYAVLDNGVYGLTKGQASPTSRRGTRTPSTPRGSIDPALVPCSFALGAGARFVARSIDTLQAHLVEVLKRAHQHRGAAFIEIFQNCVVFNDGVFDSFVAKDVAPDNQLHVAHGKPLVFGAKKDKGIRLRPGTFTLEVVTLGEQGVTESDLLVHDQTNRPLAMLLASMEQPALPMAIGVLYDDPAPSYEDEVHAQIAQEKSVAKGGLREAMLGSNTWTIGR
jgi:2-oxoglutarate/2-oxoacid ferredoxin oxidoreductase subunit beta